MNKERLDFENLINGDLEGPEKYEECKRIMVQPILDYFFEGKRDCIALSEKKQRMMEALERASEHIDFGIPWLLRLLNKDPDFELTATWDDCYCCGGFHNLKFTWKKGKFPKTFLE